MNAKQTVALLALALVTGAVLLVDLQDYVPGQAGKPGDGRDAYMDDVSLRIMNTDGVPVYDMTAGHMTHYSGSDHLELENPLLNITRPDGSVWHVSAERGVSTANGAQVWLRGAVDILRLADDTRGAIHITSTDVLVRPAEEQAETDSSALIITDSYRVEAVGLKADFKTNRLELRSRVRGRINGAG